jgi:histidine triad (HIT) family protein
MATAAAAKKVADAVKDSLCADGVNILHASGKVAEQTVFHLHLHVVPRYVDDGIHAFPRQKYQGEKPNIIAEKIRSKID